MRLLVTAALIFCVRYIASVDFEFEGDIHFAKPYLFVSLGSNCWQAQALRYAEGLSITEEDDLKAHGLRDAAFPFDWLFTLNNDGLIQCLDERFKHFTDESCFMRYDVTHVENTRYGFKFTHDWPHADGRITEEKHKAQLAYIKKKYQRRINRFENLKLFNGKVFFVRSFPRDNYKPEDGWNAQNVQNLHDALKRFFPQLDFTLVVVGRASDVVSEVGDLKGVKEYKINNLTNFPEYAAMFADLIAEYIS